MEEIIITGVIGNKEHFLIYSSFVAPREKTELRSGAATSPTFSISCVYDCDDFQRIFRRSRSGRTRSSVKKTIINTDRQN